MRNSILGFIAVLTLAISLPGKAAPLTIVHAGRLLDGVSQAPKSQVSIVIDGERIQSVQPGFISKPNARIVDLSHATVLPGLIDCHDHIMVYFDGQNQLVEWMTTTPYDDVLRAVGASRKTLLAGFTTIRDVNAYITAIVALRDAIAAGRIVGPRMWVSGDALGPTGGHNDAFDGLDPEIQHPHWADHNIDSPDEARKAVRLWKRQGVDLIKIMPSGGVTSIGDDPTIQTMTNEEIRAVVETAHNFHMKVAAHAHGKPAIDNAIRMGVDSIEHGTYADAESYRLFRQHGTYLVPTLLVGQALGEIAKAHPDLLPPTTAKKSAGLEAIMLRNLHNAYKAGVKIAFGTDQAYLPHGTNAREFGLMVKAGMSPMDAIIAATSHAADLIGSKDIGIVQPGRYADLIAVKTDPLANITVLEHIDFVMKGGIVYKSGGIQTMAVAP
jgi:imidazolonepropionase-like amidohydrolase